MGVCCKRYNVNCLIVKSTHTSRNARSQYQGPAGVCLCVRERLKSKAVQKALHRFCLAGAGLNINTADLHQSEECVVMSSVLSLAPPGQDPQEGPGSHLAVVIWPD